MVSKQIKRILFEEDMTVKDLADRLECTPENLYKKFKRDDWKESDIIEIADALGYIYEQKFTQK